MLHRPRSAKGKALTKARNKALSNVPKQKTVRGSSYHDEADYDDSSFYKPTKKKRYKAPLAELLQM